MGAGAEQRLVFGLVEEDQIGEIAYLAGSGGLSRREVLERVHGDPRADALSRRKRSQAICREVVPDLRPFRAALEHIDTPLLADPGKPLSPNEPV